MQLFIYPVSIRFSISRPIPPLSALPQLLLSSFMSLLSPSLYLNVPFLPLFLSHPCAYVFLSYPCTYMFLSHPCTYMFLSYPCTYMFLSYPCTYMFLFQVRSYTTLPFTSEKVHGPYTLLPADPSIDLWAVDFLRCEGKRSVGSNLEKKHVSTGVGKEHVSTGMGREDT